MKIALDKIINIPIHDSLYVSSAVVRPVVLDHRIWLENVASDLVTPCDILLGYRILLLLLLLFLLIILIELTSEHLERHFLVHKLASLVLALNNDACRVVRDSYSAVGLINMLTSSTSSPVGVKTVVLRLDIYLPGCNDKLSAVSSVCSEYGLTLENVAYIGDDINDLALLRRVGFSACPADAHNSVKTCVDYIAQHSGGSGVIREIADILLDKIEV